MPSISLPMSRAVRTALGALEEHVLREVGDSARVRRLVPRAGREHDEAGHRLRVIHGRRQQAQAARQRLSFGHASGGERLPPGIRDIDRLAGLVVEGDDDGLGLGRDLVSPGAPRTRARSSSCRQCPAVPGFDLVTHPERRAESRSPRGPGSCLPPPRRTAAGRRSAPPRGTRQEDGVVDVTHRVDVPKANGVAMHEIEPLHGPDATDLSDLAAVSSSASLAPP